MKFRLSVESQTFEVEIDDLNARPIVVRVDGEEFSVWPEAVAEAGLPAPAAPEAAPASGNGRKAAEAPVDESSARVVTAPIPGVITAVTVKPGERVTFGQELCTLEAMKMKNAIRSQRSGTIAAVCVTPGEHVRHGQALVEFTD